MMLTWHGPKDHPLLSGRYIVIIFDRVEVLQYSLRWNAWNVYDRDDNATYAILPEHIQAWAYLSDKDIRHILQEVER